MSLKQKVLSGLKWLAVTRLLVQLVTWAITLVVIRILGPADYGMLAMAAVFIGLMMLFAEGGVGTAIVQAPKIAETQLRQAFTLAAAINLLLFLALYACAPLIAAFFEEPRLVALVRVLGLQFVILIFAAVPEALLERELDFRAKSIASLAGGVAGAGTTLWLALEGFGVWSLAWGSLASAFVGTVCLNVAAPFIRAPSTSFEGMRELMMFGGHFTLSRVLSFVYLQADSVIAGKWLGKELLGIYAVAMQFASLPVQKMAGMLNPVALTAFARVQGSPERFAAHLLGTSRALFLLSLPVFWGMSAIAEELIPVVLGQKWEAAMLPFKLLALVMPLRMLGTFINSANFGMGRADIVTLCVATLGAVMLPAYIIAIQWEVIGLTLAWVLGFPVAFALALMIALPPAGLRAAEMWRAFAPVVICGAGMYAAVAVGRAALPPDMVAWWRMLVLIAVGAAVFTGLIWATNRDGLRNAVALLRS